MKKQLLSLLLGTMVSTSAFSQLSVIPKVGTSFSNWNISDDLLDGSDKPNYKFGMVIGAALEFGVSDNFAVQPELLFVQKGFRAEDSGDGFNLKESTTLNYLELPIMFKAKFTKFYFNAGPSLSYGLGGKYKWEVSYQGDSEDGDEKVKFGKEPDNNEDDIYIDNALDLGVQLGAGASVGPVIIDIRYGLGLLNTQDEEDGFDGDWRVRNSVFQLTVGYPIPMGSK